MNEIEVGSIERSFHLLRLLANAGVRGQALTRLSEETGLAHSTVHRLLQKLIRESAVMQREGSRKYFLGPLAFELGLAASPLFDIRDTCHPFLRRLADEAGDTVYLTVRSGLESVCEDRCEGPSPIRVVTLEVGSRRPLGLGAGGLAILSFLPDAEREAALKSVAPLVKSQGEISESALRQSVLDCRRRTYSLIRNRVTLGVTAIGIPILNSLESPIAAISIAAVDSRMSKQRIELLSAMLKARGKEIQQAVLERTRR